MNNFKRLEAELVKDKELQLRKIKTGLVAEKSIFSFIGDLVELFLPKLFQAFTGVAPTSQSKYPHERK